MSFSYMKDVRARWWAAATSSGSAAHANYIFETKRDQQIRKETCIYEKRREGSLMSSGDVCGICSTRELRIWNKKRPTNTKRDLHIWKETWGLAEERRCPRDLKHARTTYMKNNAADIAAAHQRALTSFIYEKDIFKRVLKKWTWDLTP